MTNKKPRRREQTPKPRNEEFARAMREKRNLTVPSRKAYKRPAPGQKEF